MLSLWAVQLAPVWAPILAIIPNIILQRPSVDALPWQGRRSNTIPISYRLDTWSQYNNPEEGSAREGDIHEDTLSRKTTTTNRRLLWIDGLVPYYVDSAISNEPAKLAVLEAAMDTIEASTCIKFVKIHQKKGRFPRSSWVNITGTEKGCFSDLGRAAHGPSILNLDVKRCFKTRGHALHELLHTLGVYHEHMRPDRDKYINILWENIKEGDAFNFRVLNHQSVTTYDLPYDYDSVMHYSMTAFSKDKSIPTIIPMKEDIDIGQRNHLSAYDIKKLLITYKCRSFNRVIGYSDMDVAHNDRLEILNLNSSDLLSTASQNAHRSEYDQQEDVPEKEVPYDVIHPIQSKPICPCSSLLYYFSKQIRGNPIYFFNHYYSLQQ